MPLCVVDNHLCVYVPFACLRNQQPHSKGGFRGTAGNASERFSHLPTALRLCCHLLDAGRYCRHCPSKGPQCVPGTADDARRRAVVSPGAPQCSLGCSRCFPERPRGLSRANLCAQRNASVLPELLYVFSGGFQVCPRCLQDAPSII